MPALRKKSNTERNPIRTSLEISERDFIFSAFQYSTEAERCNSGATFISLTL